MVLNKRGIQPTQDYVQQTTQMMQGPKNLVLLTSEQYTNVGLIEQLTMFFDYSSNLFGELLVDIEKSSRRIQELSSRVHNASLTLPGIEQTFEMATTGDNFISTSRIDYTSELGEQSYLFPKQTNISAITKIYDGCFKLPPLEQLDPYREDSQSCLRLYSNPNFFIESWIQAQKEKIARDKEKREERRQKRAERREKKQVNRNTEKVNAKNIQLRRDKYKDFDETGSNPSQPTQAPTQNNYNTFTPMQAPTPSSNDFGPPPSFGNTPPPPNFGNTPPPPNFGNTPPPPPNFGNTPPPPPNFGNTPPPPPSFGNTPPPPPSFGNTPPPPPSFGNTPPPPPQFNTAPPPPPQFNNAPPPPQFNSAPPPPQFNAPNAPPPPPPSNNGDLNSALHQIESNQGGGGGLLDMIKKGVNLKKSEKPVEKEIIPQDNSGFNTNLIAMVLNQRREALEDSDEDSDDSASWD